MSLACHLDPTRAVVRLEGADATKFFQGYTTQDTLVLNPGEATRAVVTTWKGTMLDWVLVLRDPLGLTLVGAPGRGATLATTLDRYVLGVDVTLEDRTDAFTVLILVGTWAKLLHDPIGDLPPLSPDATRWGAHEFPDGGILIPSHPALPEAAVLLIDRSLQDDWMKRLAELGTEVWTTDAYEAWRVGAGLPGTGTEIRDDVNPWEARLGSSVSLDKGCYLGQEVVARLLNYRKVQRHLVGVNAPTDAYLEPGMALRSGEQTIGTITSVAGNRGLALVRVTHTERAARAGDEPIEIEIEDRPFWTSQVHAGLQPPA